MELSTIEKSSATIGVVQDGTLVYEHCGQQVMVTVDTPSWYTWLETATAFTFVCEEGRFTAHKVRAGSRRGGFHQRVTATQPR